MTNKKVRVWLIFFVKLLPLVLLIGFMLYFFRHELPVTDDVVSDTYYKYVYYNEDEFNDLDKTIPSNLKFALKNFNYGLLGTCSYNGSDDVQINKVYFETTNSYVSVWNYYTATALSMELDPSGLYYIGRAFPSSSVTNIVWNYIPDFWIKDVLSYNIYDFDHTNYFDNIVKQFDDFTTSNFNFIDSLNFNDFYDFTVEHLVHNPSPIYHSVFNIMIYEIIVDLMLLLFGAFAFVINFARKWLEGIYEKW